jgi:hypothetical protein
MFSGFSLNDGESVLEWLVMVTAFRAINGVYLQASCVFTL